MRCGNWGKEPFDLRLTLLRMIRCLPWILAGTLLGTLLLGGGYFLKKVVFRPTDTYTARTTFLVDYADENWAQGLKYVNEYSWNVWMQSDTLRDFVKTYLPEGSALADQMGTMLKATVPSDLRVLQIASTAADAGTAEELLHAVEQAMTDKFPAVMEDIAAIRMTDFDAATRDVPDVRPIRALLLSVLVSFLLAVLVFVIRELTLERIWLPTTLTNVYGLKNTGMERSEIFERDLLYFLKDKKKVALCPARKGMDLRPVLEEIKGIKGLDDISLTSVDCPLCDEAALETLRTQEGVLLVVFAGTDAKYLELLLNQLAQQDIVLTAGVLWNADQWLLRSYYGLTGWK